MKWFIEHWGMDKDCLRGYTILIGIVLLVALVEYTLYLIGGGVVVAFGTITIWALIAGICGGDSEYT
jgi:hypothetical protein